eukprot:242589_1
MNTLNDQNATDIIVSKYIKDAHSFFPKTNNLYYNIPLPISNIITSYINNLFDHQGKYQWKITDTRLINKILSAKCGEKFESEPFILSRLACKLCIYPNGNREELKGYFLIHLYFNLPQYIDSIMFIRTFRVRENMTGSTWCSIIPNGEYEYWTKHCPLIDLIQLNPLTLTIDIYMNIKRIIMKKNVSLNIKYPAIIADNNMIPRKTHIEYQLNKNDINIMQQNKSKSMCSNIVNNWCISLYPKQDMDMFLKMCYIPPNISSFLVSYKMQCKQVGIKYNHTSVFTEKHHSWGPEVWAQLSTIAKLDNATFEIDVEIVKIIYHNNELEATQIVDPVQITCLLSP